MECKAVIFDLDGTLIDSMDVWGRIDVEFLGKRGLKVPADYLKGIACLGFEASADYTIRRFGFSETREEIMQEWFDMALYEYANRIELKKGAREYLCHLKKQGVKLAIATASHMDLVEAVLKRNGVYEWFDTIVTVQEVARGKGFPDVYHAAAERLGVSVESCIVYEDILPGIKGAKDGGYYTIGVYDSHSAEDMEQIKILADEYVMDFCDSIEGC